MTIKLALSILTFALLGVQSAGVLPAGAEHYIDMACAALVALGYGAHRAALAAAKAGAQ